VSRGPIGSLLEVVVGTHAEGCCGGHFLRLGAIITKVYLRISDEVADLCEICFLVVIIA
jgi:hypothetical protein